MNKRPRVRTKFGRIIATDVYIVSEANNRQMQQELLNRYFKRTGLSTVHAPSPEALATLQAAHLHTFPFENLNPLLGIPVRLDFETLFHKLVCDERGGYCYEQNILFMDVLKAIGFKVCGLTGRVMRPDRQVLARTHMLLLVEIEDRHYISDVGFGGLCPPTPLLLEVDVAQKTSLETYKFSLGPHDTYTLHAYTQGNWRPLYVFDALEQFAPDYELGNWWTSTHPSSTFVKNLMVSRLSINGRYALLNNRFSIYHLHQPDEKRVLTSPRDIREVLEKYFNLKLHNLPGLDQKLMQLVQREKER